MISRQQTSEPFEVIAIDSSSTDDSVKILRHRVDRLLQISAETFDHGLTRNLGIQHTCGELVILLVQDAIPESERWLSDLTAPMFEDETIAGVFCRQRPCDDASAITQYLILSRWIAGTESDTTLAINDPEEFARLSPTEQFRRCGFDNVCSCIRRSIWAEYPFRATPIGEDVEWAREVLLAGHRIRYVSSVAVIHSHDRSASYEFRRTLLAPPATVRTVSTAADSNHSTSRTSSRRILGTTRARTSLRASDKPETPSSLEHHCARRRMAIGTIPRSPKRHPRVGAEVTTLALCEFF